MYLILKPKTFVYFIYLASHIFSLEIDDYEYKRVEELNDKVALDPEVFLYRTLSAIQCISQCALIPNCESVFYFQSSCKGYSAVYSPSSSNLGSKYGARYYIDKQAKAGTTESNTEGTTTLFEFDQTTSISTQFATTRNTMLDLCNALGPSGYIWDISLKMCYHLNTIELIAVDAIARCQSEHPNSRLLLIDSDEIYNFAVSIIDTFNTGPIYLQGTRSGPNFIDDDGQVITYFNWDAGEPGSGTYLRTDTSSRLQEASSGGGAYKFICRLY
ncbi:uncharacterized protein LOC128155510 [Crassostrea angulata]|nr:uncharacterized protein LOC128155510 [Crassostrea angulata]